MLHFFLFYGIIRSICCGSSYEHTIYCVFMIPDSTLRQRVDGMQPKMQREEKK
jgi:hypothetical protein